MSQTLQIICNIIILLGGVAGAITAILALLGKPLKFVQQRKEKAEADCREKMTKEMEKLIQTKIIPQLNEIHQQNLEQNEDIEQLNQDLNAIKPIVQDVSLVKTAMRDTLAATIQEFYEHHKLERVITESQKETLEQIYMAYKSINGNHHIDIIYERMTTWKVVTEEGIEVENVKWWKPETK